MYLHTPMPGDCVFMSMWVCVICTQHTRTYTHATHQCRVHVHTTHTHMYTTHTHIHIRHTPMPCVPAHMWVPCTPTWCTRHWRHSIDVCVLCVHNTHTHIHTKCVPTSTQVHTLCAHSIDECVMCTQRRVHLPACPHSVCMYVQDSFAEYRLF